MVTTQRKRISIAEVGDVWVVTFSDARLTDTRDDKHRVNEIGNELWDLVRVDGYRKLILNFESVTYMDSQMLGKLITLEKLVRGINGKLVLSTMSPEIYQVFDITKLNRLFHITENKTDALTSF
ncbi:MAG: STAS domain-containing protein [Candidatus Peribacteraceae bacterium]|nr:STAS domain-containing protein [Candidatus Peribacteraceae bacterium]